MNIQDRIKILRTQKGLSQKNMADQIGISQTGYAKIEKGDPGNISISIAVGIAKSLNIGFNDLFEIAGDIRIVDTLSIENENLKNRIIELEKLIELLIESININTAKSQIITEKMVLMAIKESSKGGDFTILVSKLRDIAMKELQEESPFFFDFNLKKEIENLLKK